MLPIFSIMVLIIYKSSENIMKINFLPHLCNNGFQCNTLCKDGTRVDVLVMHDCSAELLFILVNKKIILSLIYVCSVMILKLIYCNK